MPYICLLTSLSVDKKLKVSASQKNINVVIQKPIFKNGVDRLLTKAKLEWDWNLFSTTNEFIIKIMINIIKKISNFQLLSI